MQPCVRCPVGGGTTPIALTGGGIPFTGFLGFSRVPAINSAGTVAFAGTFEPGLTGGDDGIFVGSGGATTSIVLTDDTPFSFFLGGPAINAAGTVAFHAILDNGSFGIFTGPDPVANEVIGLGDALFGSTVSALSFSGNGMNDAGQIAFWYGLANGQSGFAVANVVPEPSALALVASGLLWVGLYRSRRQ